MKPASVVIHSYSFPPSIPPLSVCLSFALSLPPSPCVCVCSPFLMPWYEPPSPPQWSGTSEAEHNQSSFPSVVVGYLLQQQCLSQASLPTLSKADETTCSDVHVRWIMVQPAMSSPLRWGSSWRLAFVIAGTWSCRVKAPRAGAEMLSITLTHGDPKNWAKAESGSQHSRNASRGN